MNLSAMLTGAVAGGIGAACMTPLRIAARRAGLIDKMVPQAAEEMLLQRLSADNDAPPGAHHLLHHTLHLGYGAAFGALYGAFAASRPSAGALARGSLLGGGTWLLAGFALFPALKIGRPAWRARASENVVNALAHLVFGLTTAYVAHDLLADRSRGPTSDGHRQRTRVG